MNDRGTCSITAIKPLINLLTSDINSAASPMVIETLTVPFWDDDRVSLLDGDSVVLSISQSESKEAQVVVIRH